MSRTLTASDRKTLIRLASALPSGSPERRAILANLSKMAAKTRILVKLKGNRSTINSFTVEIETVLARGFASLQEVEGAKDQARPLLKEIGYMVEGLNGSQSRPTVEIGAYGDNVVVRTSVGVNPDTMFHAEMIRSEIEDTFRGHDFQFVR